MVDFQKQLEIIMNLCHDNGVDYVSTISTDQIPFSEALRINCSVNQCGNYNTSWMGPPAIGDICDLKKHVQKFRFGVVIQTVSQLEDSFDYEGMMAAKEHHQSVFRNIWTSFKKQKFQHRIMALDVGCCHICESCSYPDEPCKNPDEALASVEAYGILVFEMLTNCGLKYNNGKDTVSYVGLILIE